MASPCLRTNVSSVQITHSCLTHARSHNLSPARVLDTSQRSTSCSVPQSGCRLCSRAAARSTVCHAHRTAQDAVLDVSRKIGIFAASVVLSATLASGVSARLEGVNKPELLPKEYSTVIDVAGFLTAGEENRLKSEIAAIEKDTGLKLRLLCQNYPQTPGLAIRDFWKVDDQTVVFVADPSLGNILNFNVGQSIDLQIPRNFWTRLANKYGVKAYWQKNGEPTSILNAVSAIDFCAREPVGKLQCSKIQGELGEEASSGPAGKFFMGT